jgi:glutamate-1-semialdehyde 2,1-aminomutase
VIFDEVMTGFRVAAGGAQQFFDQRPPLTCLGKIVGGGLPIGAYGGRREIMEMIAPEGPVYQAGTLSGNPLAVVSGLKTLEILVREDPYAALEERTAKLCEGLKEAANKASIPVQIHRCGSMFTIFFAREPVNDFEDAKRSDTALFGRFFNEMLNHGIYLAPSQFEACFVSVSHDDAVIEETIEKASRAFAELGG